MKRTLSRTRQARCPRGPRACLTAVHRRRVKRAGYWGVRNFTPKRPPWVSRDPCAGHTRLPGLPGGRADQGPSCPGAQTPRTRTALACRRSTTCPGWKSRRPGERRLPLQQKLEPRDPMKAAVRPVSRGLRNVGSHPFGDRNIGVLRKAATWTGIARGHPHLEVVMPLRPEPSARPQEPEPFIDPGVPQEPIPGTTPLNPQPGGATRPGLPRPRPPSPGRGLRLGAAKGA